MGRIRLVLVDDHILFRESLARLLSTEEDLELVGSCGTAQEALDLIGGAVVDLILLDYNLPDARGDETIARARTAGYDGRVLIVTGAIDRGQSSQVIQQGASGIFLKHNPAGTLVRAIRAVAAGDVWMDRKVIDQLAAPAPKAPERGLRSALTEREREVLAGVLEGLTNLKIAARTGVTEGAVKSTLQQLFEKTNVRTRGQLVRVALEGSLDR